MEALRKGYVEYEMENGDVVAMTLTFKRLSLLAKIDKEMYRNVWRSITENRLKDPMDVPIILYAAYCCANAEEENRMSYGEFLEKMNPGLNYNIEIAGDLMGPSKK